MKNWLIGAVVVALVAATAPSISEAKRLGGSKSSGMNRDMPARTAPDAPPAKPATPAPGNTPAQPGAAAPAAAGATAAAAGAAKRSWMGPVAALAAGLGIAALASALGFGEELANFLMIALLAIAAIALIAFLMRRFGRKPEPAMAGAGLARSGAQVSWPAQNNAPVQPAPASAPAQFSGSTPAAGVTDPVPGLGGAPAAEPAPVVAERSVPKAFVPAAFDSENFARTAKMIFIRLQAANDSADLEDLPRFTTPELFASLRMDILDRGASDNHTDVQRVEAEVLDVTNEEDRQIVSVRFHGDIVEERGGQPQAFNEVWHLVKPHGDAGQWAIAGIEQMN